MTEETKGTSEGRNRFELPLSGLEFQVRVNAAMLGKPRFGGPVDGGVLTRSEMDEMERVWRTGNVEPEDFADTLTSTRQVLAIKRIQHHVARARENWLARNEPGISDAVRQARIVAAKFQAKLARDINTKRRG